MGSRTADTLREIEEIRARLDGNLVALEERLPPLARKGKRAMQALGGGVGGGVALFIARRVVARAKSKPKKKTAKKQDGQQQQPIVVHAGIGLPAALAVAAVWAGVRLYEAKVRAQDATPGRSAEIKALPRHG